MTIKKQMDFLMLTKKTDFNSPHPIIDIKSQQPVTSNDQSNAVGCNPAFNNQSVSGAYNNSDQKTRSESITSLHSKINQTKSDKMYLQRCKRNKKVFKTLVLIALGFFFALFPYVITPSCI